MESKRLQILKNSLANKEALFDSKLSNHIDTVKQANGQPLNDKRNGQATLNKWEKQNNALRTLNEGIEKTKQAIENEEGKIKYIEKTKEILPDSILQLVEQGELTQWRKYPNMFFVNGVEKARIIWDNKKKIVAHKFTSAVTDQEQWSKFVQIFNRLRAEFNDK